MCTCVKDKSYSIAKAYNGSKILNQITQVEKSCQGIAQQPLYTAYLLSLTKNGTILIFDIQQIYAQLASLFEH